MKKVFTNQPDIFNAWLKHDPNKPVDFRMNSWGRSNVFSRGGRIYSYGLHFELGRHVYLPKHAVLVNTETYSNTTISHQNSLQWCLRAYTQITRLSCPNHGLFFDSAAEAAANKKQIDSIWLDVISETAERLQNKRVTSRLPRYASQMKAYEEDIKKYYLAYGLDIPEETLDVLALPNRSAIKERVEAITAQQTKESNCYKQLHYLSRCNRDPNNVDFRVIAAQLKMKEKLPGSASYVKLSEEAIKELAVRCGFDINNYWKYTKR